MVRQRYEVEEPDGSIDIEVGSQRGRRGWERLTIIYNFGDPQHVQVVDRLFEELLAARRAMQAQDAPASGERVPA
jgi:hypothetical protein